MKVSARNVLAGTVASVTAGPVNSEVMLRVADDADIVATVTSTSVTDLGLAPGVSALAIIKSSFVILAPGGEHLRTSARNSLAGTIVRREDGAVSCEITIELSSGKTLTATLTLDSAEALDFKVGEPAIALIKASHVILAVT